MDTKPAATEGATHSRAPSQPSVTDHAPPATEQETPTAPAKRERDVPKGEDDARAKFYCQPCSKQYITATEWEMHLSSYDHHHRKRWKEMNQMVSGRTKKQRLRKEQKQQTRDMDAFAEQFERARREEQSLEASKPKAEIKKLTSIQQSSKTGMVFHLKAGKKQPNKQNPPVGDGSLGHKTCDAFGEDSDE